MLKPLQGVFAPVVTTFDQYTEELDLDAFVANARAHLAAGLDGLVVTGSTGEAALLDSSERAKLVETARAHLAARQSSVVREANQIYAGVVEVFKEQNRTRLERAHVLIGNEKRPAGSELSSQLGKMSELKSEISNLDHLTDRLDRINRSMRGENQTTQ